MVELADRVGEPDARPLRVLVLCTGNSIRSQITEALLRELAGERVEVVSAGTRGGGGVHPYTLRLLEERGLDTSRVRSKSVAEFLGQRFDVVITVCDDALEACPVFPGAPRTIHWSTPDPTASMSDSGELWNRFRAVAGSLEQRVKDFVAEVVPA
ncbi:MAG TPA: arsenate reductase ArsC [Candidatus Limnocylindrales bacterium]|nr:arsenate reductase ArsC [Candidatus Limnocylindrales bacterium]